MCVCVCVHDIGQIGFWLEGQLDWTGHNTKTIEYRVIIDNDLTMWPLLVRILAMIGKHVCNESEHTCLARENPLESNVDYTCDLVSIDQKQCDTEWMDRWIEHKHKDIREKGTHNDWFQCRRHPVFNRIDTPVVIAFRQIGHIRVWQ